MIRALLGLLLGMAATSAGCGEFGVTGNAFVVEAAPGRVLESPELVGAAFEIADGSGGVAEVRIDGVEPAQEQARILLHRFSAKDPVTGRWAPLCNADAYGRRAGFPVRGRWESRRFVADPNAWFLACTSGSYGKCVLWGYDPWAKGPKGEDLADFYRACQQMTRADYRGTGEPHTRNGTRIDMADVAGIQRHENSPEAGYVFEAGWGPDGAVCVARTRWPDLLTREALIAAAPELDGPCDEAAARAKGALLFTRIAKR